MPSSGLYPFKRVYEKVILLTKRTPQKKADYTRQLLIERLIELDNTYTSSDGYLILSTNLRYSTTAGDLANLIQSNHLITEVSPTDQLFNNQIKYISTIRSHHPNISNKYLDDDIHYLELYKQQINKLK